MKFLKYLTAFAAVVGLATACKTDIEKVQIAPLEDAVAPVLHELPNTQITINNDTSGEKMSISWDAADFKAPVAILYDVCAKLGDNSVELLTGLTDVKADLSNMVLYRLCNEVEKGGLGVAYEEPTTVQIYIAAKVGANNVVYSETRDLELTISELRDAVRMYAHSKGGWSKCYIYGWDLAGCNFGDWPGTEITNNKETIDGKEYFYFDIPRDAEGNTGNIIFNNGEGQQTQDITGVKMDQSRYFIIDAEATDGKYIATEQVGPQKIKLYARSLAGWSKMFLYGWDVKGVTFEWPGIEILTTEYVDDVEWYVYELPLEAFDTTGNIIFNNGDGQQTVDITGVKFSKHRFFEVSAAPGADGKFTYTEIGGEPAPEPEPITLEGHTWALAGSMNGWSDTAMTVADGKATVTIDFAAGDKFKVRADGAWTINYGHAEDGVNVTIGSEYDLTNNGKDMLVEAAGKYNITFTIVDEVGKMKVELAE